MQEERTQVDYKEWENDEDSSRVEELNKAVRAPNDADGRTARLVHVAEDGRMTLAPLVKIRKRRINRISSGTMRRRK